MSSSQFQVRGELSLDGTKFAGGLRSAESLASGLADRLAGMFTIGAMEELVRRTVEFADRMVDLSERTATSVEVLQRLEIAARNNGTELEKLILFWEKLDVAREKALKKPGGDESKAFTRLGVSGADLASQSAQDITRKISLQFQNSSNIEQLVAPLRAIGGKGAGAIINLLRKGLDQGYQDVAVMTDMTAEKLKELKDKFRSFGQELLATIAPILEKILDILRVGWVGLKPMLPEIGGMNLAKGTAATRGQVKRDEAEIWSGIGDLFIEEWERQERIANRLKFAPIDWGGMVPAEEKAARGAAAKSDSLIAVGNFLGASRGQVTRVAEQQLAELKKVNTTLLNIALQLTKDLVGLP